MNRRVFLGGITAPITFGILAAQSNAGARFGHNAPPATYPELNWISFPDSIVGFAPMRDCQLISCVDGIYELTGCHGPFEIDRRDNRRIWAMHIDVDLATVRLWRRL